MPAVDYAKMRFYLHYGYDYNNNDTDIAESLTVGYFEQYNIMGDGSIDIYSQKPESIIVQYPDSIIGSLQVSVKKTGNIPVEGALVCAMTDTIFTGYTDASGQLTLNVETAQRCTSRVTVTGHNLRTYEGFTVACSTGIEDSIYPSSERTCRAKHTKSFCSKYKN